MKLQTNKLIAMSFIFEQIYLDKHAYTDLNDLCAGQKNNSKSQTYVHYFVKVGTKRYFSKCLLENSKFICYLTTNSELTLIGINRLVTISLRQIIEQFVT